MWKCVRHRTHDHMTNNNVVSVSCRLAGGRERREATNALLKIFASLLAEDGKNNRTGEGKIL